MKYSIYFAISLLSYGAFAQESYINHRDEKHLCGVMEIEDLLQEPYADWYNKNYEADYSNLDKEKWAKKLKGIEVDIFLGTWCGDSKRWVPRFVKLWDELGLSRDQLNFIALYDSKEKYKQGPKGEEQGKKVFRVPTFIFKQNENEIARIVEFPVNDLKTDLAQIALGQPSDPNYRAANYLSDQFEQRSADEIGGEMKVHLRALYKKVRRSSELNSFGYILLGRGEMDKALIAFELNTYLFRNDGNTYDSYAEALLKAERYEDSLKFYEKALEIDPGNENAQTQIAQLTEQLKNKG